MSVAIRTLLALTAMMVLLACGGLFNSDDAGGLGTGQIRVLGTSPNSGTPGSTVAVVVEAVPSFGEGGRTYTVSASGTNGATVSPLSRTAVFGSGGSNLHVVNVGIPANATAGSTIVLTIGRTSESTPIPPTTHTITVAATGLAAAFSPTSVSGPVGGNATSTLTITPNGVSGQVSLLGYLGDTVITPATINIPAGSTTPVTAQVTYRIPSAAAIATPIDVPVRVSLGSNRTAASFTVTPTSNQNQPSFNLSVQPAQINVSGQQVSAPVTVTVNPVNGFRGPVTINISLPGSGSLRTQDTLPLNLDITSDLSVTRNFNLIYFPGTGTAPIGTGTVTATGAGGINQRRDFQVSAS